MKRMQRCTATTKQSLRCKRKALPDTGCCSAHSKLQHCSICMGTWCKAKSTTLSCDHTFCTSCIERWLETGITCPVCRTKVRDAPPAPPALPVYHIVFQCGNETFMYQTSFLEGDVEDLQRFMDAVIAGPLFPRDGELRAVLIDV